MKLHILRYRTHDEKEYAVKVSRTADLAADNVQAFAQLEIQNQAGGLDDFQVAMQTQKMLNLENQLDYDYQSPREGYGATYARHPLQTSQLQLTSQRLIKVTKLYSASKKTAGLSLDQKDLKADSGNESLSEILSNPDEKPNTKRDADIFEAAIDEREKIEAEIIQAELLVESFMFEEISKEFDFACDIPFLF